MGLHTNFKESLKSVKKGKERKKFEVYGHSVNLYVRSTRGNHLYELENCVFVNY